MPVCHVAATGFTKPYVLPNGNTEKERLDLCRAANRDLATQQTRIALSGAIAAYAKFVNENYHDRCLGPQLHESFSYQTAPQEYHQTLRYYDQAGSLVQTVPPAGIRALTQQEVTNFEDADPQNDPDGPHHTLRTRYQYNSLGEVIWQETPDSGWRRFW